MTTDFQPKGRRRQGLWILLILGGLAAIALVAYMVAHRSGQGRGGRPPAPVAIARVGVADVPVTLNALGTVTPVVVATVQPQEPGTLFRILFREGQMVRKGQVLAEIDPRPFRLAAAQAAANLARDTAQLNGAKVDLRRYRTLQAEDSIAGQQVDTEAALVKQLTGTVAADRAALGTARLNLSYTYVRSPITGRAGLRQTNVGDYVTSNLANGIVVVTQTDPIDVAFALPQQDIAPIERAGPAGALPVTAVNQDGTGTIATGRFLTLDNQVDTSTGTVKAKARFANDGGRLFPNQFVNVSMLVDTLHHAVVVPVSAVRHGAPGDFVFVLRPDHTVKLTVVKVGPIAGQNVAILTGLRAGEQVVTEGADGLDDGSKVRLPGDTGGASGGFGGAGGRARHKAAG